MKEKKSNDVYVELPTGLTRAQIMGVVKRDLPPLHWSRDYDSWTLNEGNEDAQQRHAPQEIIGKLREVEIRIGQGVSAAKAVRSIGVRPDSD